MYLKILQEVVEIMVFQIHEAGKTGRWNNYEFIENLNMVSAANPYSYHDNSETTGRCKFTTSLGDVFEYDVITYRKWVNDRVIFPI